MQAASAQKQKVRSKSFGVAIPKKQRLCKLNLNNGRMKVSEEAKRPDFVVPEGLGGQNLPQ